MHPTVSLKTFRMVVRSSIGKDAFPYLVNPFLLSHRFEAFVSQISFNEGYVVRKKLGRDPSDTPPNSRESEAPGDYKRKYYLQKVLPAPTPPIRANRIGS